MGSFFLPFGGIQSGPRFHLFLQHGSYLPDFGHITVHYFGGGDLAGDEFPGLICLCRWQHTG
ncbi:MAG: hypothetical protein MZV64_48495 [Ignavibacteriales bacterium]|nr:hypothetical protein [Ignavibacteriales bacterium]